MGSDSQTSTARSEALQGGRDHVLERRQETAVDRHRAITTDPPHVRGMAAVLQKNIAAGEEAIVWGLLMQLMSKHRGRQYIVDEIRRVVDLYGGEEKLTADLKALLIPVHQYIIPHIKRKLNWDRPLPEDIERLRRAEQVTAISQNVNQLLQDFAEDFFGVTLSKIVDEILATAKTFYQRQAEELADEGHWVLAGMLATMSDLALPGNTLEAAMNVIPFGRAGGLTRILIDRAARRSAAQMAAKAGIEITEEALQKETAVYLTKINSAISQQSHPVVNQVADLAASQPTKNLDEFIQVANKTIDDLTPPVIRDFEQTILREGSRPRRIPALDELFSANARRIDVDYVVLEDGRVIQFMRSKLQRRRGGRASNAAQTARSESKALNSQGLDLDLAKNQQDMGHIIPDVLSGEDKLYNLVVMDSRFNRSIYKNIDELVNTPGIHGKEVQFYVEFKSIEDAKNRIASGIVIDLPQIGNIDPRFIILGDPLNRPPQTFGEVMQGLKNFFKKAEKAAQKATNKKMLQE